MTARITLDNARMVADAELRFTPKGDPVASLRVVENERVKGEDGSWKDGSSSFYTVICWKQMAERVTEDLKKGDLIFASGIMRQRDYETKEGEKRSVYEITADAIGPLYKWLNKKNENRTAGKNAPAQFADDEPPF